MNFNKTSSLFYYTICLLFAVSLKLSLYAQTPRDSISFYQQLISHSNNSEDLSKAFQFFNRMNAESVKIQDTVSIIYNTYQMARIEYKAGQLTDSETSAVKALRLIDGTQSTSYTDQIKKNLVNLLGILYREQDNFEQANKLYQQALSIAETPKDSAMLYNNRSNTYKDAKEYERAYQEILKAEKLIARIPDSSSIALIYDNMGYLQFKLGRPDAENSLQKSFNIRKNLDNQITTYPSLNNLSQYYENQNPQLAKQYATEALEIANAFGNSTYIQDALKRMVDIGDDRYLKPYLRLSDSLNEAKQSQANRFALLKYDVSKKEQELRESQLKAEIETSQKQLYQLLALLLILIVISLVVILKIRHRRKELQKVYETETRISKKVHDEVANDLYLTMNRLQSKNPPIEDILDDLDLIYQKTRNIAKDGNFIDFEADFAESLNDLLLAYKNTDTQIITKGIYKVNWQKVSKHRKTAIYRVIQELMTNMKKHSQASIASISFLEDHQPVAFKYTDNGVGSLLQKHGGLQNVENRIKALKGTVTFETDLDKGFKASITV